MRSTADSLEKTRTSQSSLPFTYPYDLIGGADRLETPRGYRRTHFRTQLGVGEDVRRSACRALDCWDQFPSKWISVHPPNGPATIGSTILIVARAFGIDWVNPCRIIAHFNSHDSEGGSRYGYAFGTLPGHMASGEERFMIEFDTAGRVWYDVRAFSKFRHPLVRLVTPVAKSMQSRFARESIEAMRQAVAKELSSCKSSF